MIPFRAKSKSSKVKPRSRRGAMVAVGYDGGRALWWLRSSSMIGWLELFGLHAVVSGKYINTFRPERHQALEKIRLNLMNASAH